MQRQVRRQVRRFIWRRASQFRTVFDLRQDGPLNRLVRDSSDDSIRKRTSYLLPPTSST
ncbi:MAG: hypothetical protein ACYC9D_13105 [Candidatus Dormibacteria bacterium]